MLQVKWQKGSAAIVGAAGQKGTHKRLLKIKVGAATAVEIAEERGTSKARVHKRTVQGIKKQLEVSNVSST